MDKIVLNNMSDIRINYFEGSNDIIYANLSSGFREEVFAYDGESTSPVECAVLTVGYFNTCSYSQIAVVINVDGEEMDLVLERSPYEDVFMEDVGKIINNGSIVKLRLKNQEGEIELYEKSNNWLIDYEKAINISTNHFKEKLEALYFNSKLNAECYLKIVSKLDYEDKFWYFSIIDRSGKNYSLLINVKNGQIVSNSEK